MSFAYEVLEHLLGHLKVGDHTIFHRADGDDVAGGPAKHLLGLLADGLDFVSHLVYCDNGRLTDNDSASFCVN
jgi:hypothetical protein